MFRFILGAIVGFAMAATFPETAQRAERWMRQDGVDLMQRGVDQIRESTRTARAVPPYQNDDQQPYQPAGSRYQATGNPVPLHGN